MVQYRDNLLLYYYARSFDRIKILLASFILYFCVCHTHHIRFQFKCIATRYKRRPLEKEFRVKKKSNGCTSVASRAVDVKDIFYHMGRAKRICYLSPMRAAKVQASLRIRAVSPEPSLLAHTSSELRGTFRQKTRSLAPLNGWACAVKVCHDGMLEDTNSLGFFIICGSQNNNKAIV